MDFHGAPLSNLPNSHGDALYKLPELRRRSRWGRLKKRPALLGFASCTLVTALVAGTYLSFRLTGNLPGQIMARRSNAAMAELVKTPEFDDFVVRPIRDFLTRNLYIGAHPDDLIRFIRTSAAYPDISTGTYERPASDPSILIGGWRDIIAELNKRGLWAPGLTTQREESDLWLRSYVIDRVLSIDTQTQTDADLLIGRASTSNSIALAPNIPSIPTRDYIAQQRQRIARITELRHRLFPGSDPQLFARNTTTVDTAVNALVASFGVDEQEFDTILYLANCSQQMRNARTSAPSTP